MAKKKTSTKEKSEKLETDVILIVKGAGEQAEDDHLNTFLRGFWPAVTSLDKNATIARVSIEEDGDSSSPHEEGGSHKYVTEIRAKLPDPEKEPGKYIYKRIWLKESYWEYEVLPSTALSNLSKEWQLSSHVFANMFQDIVFTRDTDKRRHFIEKEKNKVLEQEYFQPTVSDYIGGYISYTLLFLLVLLPLVVAPYVEPGRISEFLAGIFPSVITSGSTGVSGIVGFGLALAIAIIWALAPALMLGRMTTLRFKTQSNKYFRRVPGLPSWTLVLLIFLLLTFPVSYLVVLLVVLSIQISTLFARRILWRFRKYSNTDSDSVRANGFYDYELKKDNKIRKQMGKVYEPWLLRLPFSPLFYRYFIFLFLPIGFLITTLAGFLKWTKILGGFGEALDGFIKFMLVGYMDDVVNYATDPAQAHRVRSVVIGDIMRFHDLNQGREVQRIHVVAHSQGTPITFEALFHFLPTDYQKKILTYVTLGSVLSYYHQARGIIDPVYYNRFKMPIRDDEFPKEFKWMNFWNFTDPITEFYGLDEYNWFEGTWKDKEETEVKRGYTSPVNIRTRSSLAKNHGEYWDNLDKLQRPFAKRVLGELRPEEWNPEPVGRQAWHHLGAFLLSPITLLLLLGAGYGVYWLAQNFVLGYFSTVYADGFNVFQLLFPPKAGSEPSLLQNLFSSATLTHLQQLWGKILAGTLVVLSFWAVFDWASHLWRTYNLGRDDNSKDESTTPSNKTKS